ncbi:nuclear speckle splicing regulatory protein 1 [Bombina bombina]|uniref:nuclear speckle splicing regulatory protein 1 n=1 Tax=Bombina bombina TaxID=8345 RepID=UPI00235AA212|nr:nuclear speckle splicing regulatory protein 1 [Bombina bombina]
MAAPGKQYGLIMPKKLLQRNVFAPKHSAFADDSDDETSVGESLQKESMKKRFMKQTKLEIQKALAEDSSVYEYDNVYDDMQKKKEENNAKVLAGKDRKPKYIQNILKAAEVRKKEQEKRMEKQIQKEREMEGEEFKDKEAFVTSAYKKKLQEKAEEEEREKREAALEASLDVTKQNDLSGFYRHLLNQTVGEEETPECSLRDTGAKKSSDEPNQKISSIEKMQEPISIKEENIDADSDLGSDSSEEEDKKDDTSEQRRNSSHGVKKEESSKAYRKSRHSSSSSEEGSRHLEEKIRQKPASDMAPMEKSKYKKEREYDNRERRTEHDEKQRYGEHSNKDRHRREEQDTRSRDKERREYDRENKDQKREKEREYLEKDRQRNEKKEHYSEKERERSKKHKEMEDDRRRDRTDKEKHREKDRGDRLDKPNTEKRPASPPLSDTGSKEQQKKLVEIKTEVVDDKKIEETQKETSTLSTNKFAKRSDEETVGSARDRYLARQMARAGTKSYVEKEED